MPARVTRTSTWSSDGSGTSRSTTCMTSGPPHSVIWIARMARRLRRGGYPHTLKRPFRFFFLALPPLIGLSVTAAPTLCTDPRGNTAVENACLNAAFLSFFFVLSTLKTTWVIFTRRFGDSLRLRLEVTRSVTFSGGWTQAVG